jgi:iron complex outermembrane receptor protein
MNSQSTCILALILPAALATPAFAQSQQTAGQPGASSIQPASAEVGEIVVTARRRAENIERVPIAITAVGREQLQQRSIFSEADLQRAVPGLTIRENGSSNQFNYAIRGQSVDTYTNSPPGVLTYIDEAPIASHSASSFFDLENVQVLKGPQGTLFGRNTTGGAILYQTARPGDTFGGYVRGRYGNHNAGHLEGAVSLPINDVVKLRVAGSYTGGGAFVHNIATDSDLGLQDTATGRVTLVLTPMAGLTNTTVAQHTSEGGTNTPSLAYSAYACGATHNGAPLYSAAACLYSPGSPAFDAFSAAHPNLYPGGVVAFTALQRARGPWTSDVNYPLYHQAHSTFVINTTAYEVSPALTVKNIFAYNRNRSADGFDYDGTPYPVFQAGGVPTAAATGVTNATPFVQATRQFSEELQLQGKAFDNRLVYVLGAYFLDERDENDSNLYAFDFSPIAPGVGFRYHQQSTDQSKAVFAQGTYSLTDRLKLTAGYRYTWDRQTARQLEGSVFGTSFPEEEMNTSNPSWTTSLDYQLTPSLLVYVASRGSWRTGGYNYSALPVNAMAAAGGNAFGPEKTKDVELGFKYSGAELGLPVTFNADVFDQRVTNIQRAIYVIGVGGSPSLFTVNVPKAEIRGAEADLSVRPTSWITFGGAVSYTDARYTDNLVNILGSPTRYGPFADTPKWSGNIFAELTHQLSADQGSLKLHVDVYGQTKMEFSNVGATLAPFTTIPGYSLTNARLSWSNLMGSRVTAALFARNLFNKEYFSGGNAVGPSLGINTSVPGAPRMYGAELSVEF